MCGVSLKEKRQGSMVLGIVGATDEILQALRACEDLIEEAEERMARHVFLVKTTIGTQMIVGGGRIDIDSTPEEIDGVLEIIYALVGRPTNEGVTL